jgi:UDPglucose--hexose-1-phosphate uridylyltransferase
MIRFDAETIEIPLHFEEGRSSLVEVQLRRDPLSGEQCRITPRRPSTRPKDGARTAGGERRSPPAERGPCPLCSDQIAHSTPRLDPAIFTSERLERGEAVLFPNLYPYGRWSAVIALTEAHWVPLDDYQPEHYVDGLSLAIDYARHLMNAGHGPWLSITQNHLPTSGGTLLHPHLQVHVDERPNNFFARVGPAAADFRRREGVDYFDALVATERGGERWITEDGGPAWLCPFAPKGYFEFWALVPDKRSVFALEPAEIAALAKELCSIFGFYRGLGWDAFNLALCTHEAPGSDSPVWLRVVLRGRFSAYARSDVSFHEKLLEEISLSMSPEDCATYYKGYRTKKAPG